MDLIYRLLNQAKRLELEIVISNPVDYIRLEDI